MKILLILCIALMGGFVAAEDDEVLSQDAYVEYNGKFHYHYVLADGSKVTQDGVQKSVDPEHNGEAITGTFAFIGSDGKEYVTSYIADENGYQPIGAHLPTPPPIPDSVIKTLKYLEEHPYVPPEKKQ